MNPFSAIIGVCQFIFLLTFHEWGHAKSAEMLGDDTAKRLDRVSFNPAVHIDLVGTIILPLIGMMFGGMFFGWAKPVPVDPRNLKDPKRDMMLIAAAGPAMNIILAIAIFGVYKIAHELIGFPQTRGQYQIVQILVYRSALISIFLAIFNMLPLFPLDGFSVTYGLLPWSAAQKFDRLRPYGMPILMGLIFLPDLLHVPNPVFGLISFISFFIFDTIRLLVGLG